MNRFNRPSVIVFNVENDLNRNSVIVSNQNEQINNFDENSSNSVIFLNQNELINNEIEPNNFEENSTDSVIVLNSNAQLDNNIFDENSGDSIILLSQNEQFENNFDTISRENSLISANGNNIDENSTDSFENYFDNDNNSEISARPPNINLSEEEYLNIIRNNYQMSNERNQFSKLYGMLFSHFKTKINPHIYQELQPDNFMDLFRDIFQDIFNRVLEKIEAEFPNKFGRVKVNLKANELNVNLQFLPLTDISSELFLIELYRLLQSKKDIVTSSEIELSFTFLPKN